MADEWPIYHDEDIQITNLRAMLHGKTYAVANVTSVSMFTQFANKAPGVLVAILGVFFGLVGLAGGELQGCFVFFAAVLVVVGVLNVRASKNVYWVRIGSSSGETNALSSNDPDYILRVVGAMNEAIVRRG